ncbi:hypothetical protein KI387_013564, partial [Taxus chinensis]
FEAKSAFKPSPKPTEAKVTINVVSPSQTLQTQSPHHNFTKLPNAARFLLPQLIKSNLITLPLPLNLDPSNPCSHNYDENVCCDYHQCVGHSTDRCFTLKHIIQDLIENNSLEIPKPSTSNPVNDSKKLKIFNGPFPKHDTQAPDSFANHTHRVVPPPSSGPLDFLVNFVDASPSVITFSA